MKVGSPDPEADLRRAKAIRDEIGPENVLMMDANQKWDVPEALGCANAVLFVAIATINAPFGG